MRRHLRALPVTLAVLSVAACGSTVVTNGGGQAAGGITAPGSELGGGGAVPGAELGAPVDGGAGFSGGAAAPGSVGGPAAEGAVVSPTESSGEEAAPAAGPVVGGSKAPMQVGITYYKDPGEGLKAIGVQGATLGDQRRYAEVVVEDLNRRGGLGGRRVVPVFFEYDANPGAASIPQQDQEACAAFLEDNKVELAVVNLAGDNLIACLQKRGIPMITEGYTSGDTDASLRRARLLFQIDGFTLDRRAVAHVSALRAQKWFTPWDNVRGAPAAAATAAPVKVGIVTYDHPYWLSSARGPLTKAFVAAGVDAPQVYAVAPPTSYDNLTRMASQVSAAVLSLKSSGVTHVVVWDDKGVTTLLFMREAEQQGYRPRYGVNTGNNMKLMADGGLANPNQLNGAVGMGWAPIADVAEGEAPDGKYGNPARKRCDGMMAKAGANSSGYNEGSALMYCVPFAVLEDRFSRTPIRTSADFIRSLEALGGSYQSPIAAATWISPTRHDGMAGVRHYAYNSASGRMTYTGGVVPLPRS